MNEELISISELKAYENNARVHDEEQIASIKKSIEEFGFISPVIIDENNMILVGHGRVEAAKQLNIEKVPFVRVSNLNEDQKKGYILSDNLLTERGGWDMGIVKSEIDSINIDMTDFGFKDNEIDIEDNSEEDLIICPKCGYEFSEGEMYE